MSNPCLNCLITLTIVLFLASCAGSSPIAPVRNLSFEPEVRKVLKSRSYQVRKGDTLYSIAFRFGIDSRILATINKIKMPYIIFPEQILQLRDMHAHSTDSKTTQQIVKKSRHRNAAKQQNNSGVKGEQYSKTKAVKKDLPFDNKKKVTSWLWPVKNKDQKKFSSWKGDQQGINISGHLGEPIRAVADGRVVYSGSGLVGYGKLIIIKHSQSYLSAYANNQRLDVSEKNVVKAGQQIARMGKNGTGQVQLHFEIRYQGRPVDPLKYLPTID